MKRVLTSFAAASVLAGTFLWTSPASVDPVAAKKHNEDVAPVDLGIVNQDRLIKSLTERGVIKAGLNPQQQEAELNKYLKKRAGGSSVHLHEKHDVEETANFLKGEMKSTADSGSTTTSPGKGGKKSSTATVSSLDSAQAETYSGDVRKDQILVLLIDYNDYKEGSITPSETDFHYPKYTQQHYRDMIFGDNGYTGPNGKNMVSMKQFYLQQSGGSYTIDGDVYGWYTAKNDAAYYGGNNASDNDSRPRNLVAEALAAAAANGVDLTQYDKEDIYDLDGDGNKREPDGLVDHLMVVHAGVGEEAGGGSLGADAIWSHRWNLGGVYAIPGSTATVPYWGGAMGAYDYTIEPEDGATGVFAHEFGHDLNYPDEYDTVYSTPYGEPVSYWSIMSSGSWAGEIPGTEPTGFSPLAKEFYQSTIGGKWLQGKTVDVNSLGKNGVTVTLDQASTKGTNEDAVRINLPDQVNQITTPASGSYAYYGGRGDEIDHKMVTNVDLTGATSATLDYDAWYKIESNWDYAMVQVSTDNGVTWKSLSTPNTNSDLVADGYPAIKENLPGYTGHSNGWIHESIDLSQYAGQNIQLQFRYMTDWGSNEDGFFVDNVKVTKDGATAFEDGAEGTPKFALDHFEKHEGKELKSHYYLVEWRNHDGVDNGLAHLKRGNSIMSYDPGMVIWYVNNAYDNNWVGSHLGKGFVGVVDAHQNVHRWGGNVATGDLASTRYQIYDAPFSKVKGAALDVDYGQGNHMYQAAKAPVSLFDDTSNYWSPSSPYSGLKLPSYGLKIEVLEEAADRSTAKIKITK
ncbi:immune inhibitor A [Fictibacillus nanhaiensis]|uniref:immune inhibitor A domain-containing protein n=1 Tax=Fictibacillus nanhaiensis TaxID=742169 RepID=UPI00203CFB0C|nr:immune inhibitor A domain-containing protein [Fictibacillus nanhaiensis]MCM3731894.1 immune inhibitor A [Fictibacillus nanhaiensis]